MEHRKKEKKKKKKEKEKEKMLQESPQIKGEVNIFEEKNISTSTIIFDVIPFSPPPSYHFKNLSKIIEKVFLTLFGASFSLAIYITSVLPFLFAHELDIFSL
jgi:uncharacterized protein YqhQ